MKRSATFHNAIEVIVIDAHAGYATAMRAALPTPGSQWTTSA